MWHSERLVGTGLLFSATKWSMLLPLSFNTLSTGIHADSQHNLFWKRHGGLMRNFCPKYGSFVVVMPPQGNSILSAWHPPKAALTHRAKCQDKGYQASSLPPQWNKPQESVALLLYMLQHVMSSTDLHGSGMQGIVYRLGCPYLVSFLQTGSNLDTVSPRRQDCTAQNVHLCRKLNLVLIVSISFF